MRKAGLFLCKIVGITPLWLDCEMLDGRKITFLLPKKATEKQLEFFQMLKEKGTFKTYVFHKTEDAGIYRLVAMRPVHIGLNKLVVGKNRLRREKAYQEAEELLNPVRNVHHKTRGKANASHERYPYVGLVGLLNGAMGTAIRDMEEDKKTATFKKRSKAGKERWARNKEKIRKKMQEGVEKSNKGRGKLRKWEKEK